MKYYSLIFCIVFGMIAFFALVCAIFVEGARHQIFVAIIAYIPAWLCYKEYRKEAITAGNE